MAWSRQPSSRGVLPPAGCGGRPRCAHSRRPGCASARTAAHATSRSRFPSSSTACQLRDAHRWLSQRFSWCGVRKVPSGLMPHLATTSSTTPGSSHQRSQRSFLWQGVSPGSSVSLKWPLREASECSWWALQPQSPHMPGVSGRNPGVKNHPDTRFAPPLLKGQTGWFQRKRDAWRWPPSSSRSLGLSPNHRSWDMYATPDGERKAASMVAAARLPAAVSPILRRLNTILCSRSAALHVAHLSPSRKLLLLSGHHVARAAAHRSRSVARRRMGCPGVRLSPVLLAAGSSGASSRSPARLDASARFGGTEARRNLSLECLKFT
mmetsp:Transcript_14505/g.43316  ORF Transcript_14505/g.43316 Transcript_14505/m.43316 type:complete len:322 (-) Transcript_14505:27-992(-)